MKKLPIFQGKRGPKLPRLPKTPTPEYPAPPRPSPVPVGATDAGPFTAEYLTQTLDNAALAKRVQKLKAQFPVGTLPELVVYDWLTRQGIGFEYQVAVYGGRARRGGLVPDFVVDAGGGRVLVWLVQGEYWHTLAEKRNADAAAQLALLGTTYNGAQPVAVVELWEQDIYHKAPQVFNLALAGQGLRR